jgi:hypothetical protein
MHVPIPVFYWQSGTVLEIALRAVVQNLQTILKSDKKNLHEKRPFSTFKCLQGGHFDLADTPMVFLSGLW